MNFMSIFSIINFIKKRYLLIGVVIAIILIIFISKYDNKPTIKRTLTVPLVTDIDIPQIKTLPENFSQTYTDEKRISITDSERVIALNDNDQLIIISDNKPIIISPTDLKIVNYVTSGDSVLYETGIYQNPNNRFFLHDLTNNQVREINLNFLDPIISYSISPELTSLAILGKYNAKSFSSNVYLFHLQKETVETIETNIQINEIYWVNDKSILLGKNTDNNEPNYSFSLYSVSENRFLVKDIAAVKKSISLKENQIFYIDSLNNNLSSVSLINGQTTEYFKVDSLNYEIVIFSDITTIGLLDKTNTNISLEVYNLSQNKIINTLSIPLDKNETYIEKYSIKNQYFIKTYNNQTKKYSIKAINFPN